MSAPPLHPLHVAADKFLYGSLSAPHQPMRILAAIGNAADAAYFLHRGRREPLLVPMTVFVLAFTALIHATMRSAVGMSTIWSFLYGLQRDKTRLDHVMYWGPCALMVLPLPWLDDKLAAWTGGHLWPWPPEFAGIAIGAHAIFALLGVWAGHLTDPAAPPRPRLHRGSCDTTAPSSPAPPSTAAGVVRTYSKSRHSDCSSRL